MYPALDALRKIERTSLLRIVEIGEFGRLGELQNEAQRAAASINDSRGSINVNLGFTLDVRLRGDRKARARRIDLGALVQASNDNKTMSNASYSLVVCKYADPASSPIVRKMHFDYEPVQQRNVEEPKPSCHMQICGKLSPHHKAAGYQEIRLQAMYPGWEKPRVPMPPTCIAMLLNWLLLEFQADPASQAVLRSPAWRNVVSRAERAILLPYYKAATKFLDTDANATKRFLQAYLYEMQTE